MARFNKMKVKKLYLGTDAVKSGGQNRRTTLVTTTADELNVLDGATTTNNTTNKAAILDSGGILNLGGDLIATGYVNGSYLYTSLPGALQTASYGAGAVSTAFAPREYIRTENGHIVTEIHVDLTGLACKGDAANDVIGLAAGGAAYITRYVTATHGIVYRAEVICIETPGEGTATITTDIDIAFNSSALLEYDGAAGAAELNLGGVAAGNMYIDNTLALTANDYMYLVEGDTAATTGVYNAGQLIIRLYGHALIT